jgi:ribonuclease D
VGQEKNGAAPAAPQYHIINTNEALNDFIRAANSARMVAVDLEADSMFHYREKVCLIQMAANGHNVVIDPLEVSDLSPLRPLFADETVRKVFHGADYDVRSLYRDFDITINNLFDTQLASMYMGYKETGLESVVSHRYGVELNKKFQKKDWSQRPLPDEMIAYAASDVVFLIPLAKALTEELQAKGRLAWVEEECRLLSRVRPPQNNDAPLFLKVKGAGHLTPRQLAVLEALLQVRNLAARHKDRPLFKIISNAALIKLAVTAPTSLKALQQANMLSDRQVDMYGHDIVAAVTGAKQIAREELPIYPRQRSPRLSPRVPGRVKALRIWRDKVAEKLELDPALLFNKALIRDIAIQKPRTEAELAAVQGIHQWQVRSYGNQILNIINE